PSRPKSSSGDSSYTFYPKASSAFGILDSWPISSEPHPWNFAENCSTWPRSFVPLKPPTPTLPACVPAVISPLPFSQDLTPLSFDGDSLRHASQTPHNSKPSAASWCAECTPTPTCVCTSFLLSQRLVALPDRLHTIPPSACPDPLPLRACTFIPCIPRQH